MFKDVTIWFQMAYIHVLLQKSDKNAHHIRNLSRSVCIAEPVMLAEPNRKKGVQVILEKRVSDIWVHK